MRTNSHRIYHRIVDIAHRHAIPSPSLLVNVVVAGWATITIFVVVKLWQERIDSFMSTALALPASSYRRIPQARRRNSGRHWQQIKREVLEENRCRKPAAANVLMDSWMLVMHILHPALLDICPVLFGKRAVVHQGQSWKLSHRNRDPGHR